MKPKVSTVPIPDLVRDASRPESADLLAPPNPQHVGAHRQERDVRSEPINAPPADSPSDLPRRARRPGRPTKLTPELQATIVEAIRNGNYAEVAARATGVTSSTFFLWKQRGMNGEPRYASFVEAIDEAEAYAETQAVAVITTAMRDDPKHAAWYLERKHASRWGARKPEVRDLTVNQTANHVTVTQQQVLVPLDRLSDDELALLEKIYGKAGPPTVDLPMPPKDESQS